MWKYFIENVKSDDSFADVRVFFTVDVYLMVIGYQLIIIIITIIIIIVIIIIKWFNVV